MKSNEYSFPVVEMAKEDLIEYYMKGEGKSFNEAKQLADEFMKRPLKNTGCLERLKKELEEIDNMSAEDIIKSYEESLNN